MPRTISIPEQDYTVGTYEATVDQFTPQTDRVIISFTRVGWPGVPSDSVARISVHWSPDGQGVVADLPGGVILARDGQPLAASSVALDVPSLANAQGNPEKRNQVSARAVFEVFQPLRTAISMRAIAK